jgi:hypothetical protein
MELATCRYVDFPGVGVIDLEAPQLPEKELEVAMEWMLAEPTIMEMIASVSKALHEYERAGGFAPHAASEAVPEAPATGMEPAADPSAPPPISESREAPLPQPAEAVETAATVAATGTAEVVVGEAGSSSSLAVAAEVDEVCVPDESAATVQEPVAPEGTTRAASQEIQEVEETGASLSRGVAGPEVQALELACTSWAATSRSGDVFEGDEEVVARNTLECGLNWACRTFGELILPATLVSFLA